MNYFEEELQVGHQHREYADGSLQAAIIYIVIYVVED
jgi:hypothetical protein